jgi:predicted transcriptional regulator
MSNKRDIKQLIEKAQEQGWIIIKTSNNHYKWISPLGGLFYSASTPSDYKAIKNIKRDMKANGFIEIQRNGKRNR